MAVDAPNTFIRRAVVILGLRAFYVDGVGWITTTGSIDIRKYRDENHPGKRILATLRPKGSEFYVPAITFKETIKQTRSRHAKAAT